MRTIGVRDLQAHIGRVIADAQADPVVVLRHAQPVAVVVGVDGADLDQVLRQAADFMRTIESSKRSQRRGPPMNPEMTTILFRFDELATRSRIVSIAELRRRVAQDGVVRPTFDTAVLELEAIGILELIASGAPQTLPPADVADCVTGPKREILCSAIRATP